MSESILAWHFLPAIGRLSNGDPREVVVGKTIVHKGAISICNYGLHASRSILDALYFQKGTVLCRVRCSVDIAEQDDKLVCRERTCLAMEDITTAIRKFAIDCAERALPTFEARYPNDARYRKAIEAAKKYLSDPTQQPTPPPMQPTTLVTHTPDQ